MKSRSTRTLLLGSLMVLVVLTAAAVAYEDIPLKDWTVPMYSLSGLGKAVDATSPRAFIGLPPCRVIDTRPGGTAPLGPPGVIFPDSGTRNFVVTGHCGIPVGADAISANFTVVGGPSAPPGAFILAHPTGSPPSPPVSLLNFQANQVIANAAIVPLSAGGSLTISVSHSTDVIVDVNGYFSDTLGSPTNYFEINNNSGLRSIYTTNASTTCGGDCGITANISSTGGGWAITGSANGATGRNHGVHGETSSSSADSVGVFGVDDSGSPAGNTGFRSAGVRGESADDIGVHGIVGPNGIGTIGRLNSAAGALLAQGFLGFASGGTNYGVWSQSNYGGTGAKHFVEPHPEQADMVIRYVALEGPESGTYFRGRGKFVRGLAEISVPDSFRMVTDSEGLSIQVTPIGEMATVAVSSIGLDKIVVRGSRNVEFFYLVNGIRKTHKHLTAIGPGREYMPESADSTMPGYLTEGQKEMLISNGTYKEDGTVNTETAQRLGWDQVWKARSEQRSKNPTPKK